ncbi:hypothetical protein [Aeromicrobium massiliense]|uniref:hypothetical protein n=1 Tax=Aeromicrobium massiliense TaxID=1464554 RepID=UPI0002ED6748|nr:hypothetical protein [Aeromicrobium massiliense]
MPRTAVVPPVLRTGPFSRAQGLAAGLTSRQLQGASFRRVHPRVWVHRDHVMTRLDEVRAATLALPPHVHATHATRLLLSGLDVVRPPLRFVVAGDLHLALDGVLLHRTPLLPPLDEQGVTPTAAFVALAATERLLDVVAAGDWLAHRGLMSAVGLGELAAAQSWRRGARAAASVLPLLDGRSRSLPESQVRCLLVAAGLPRPEVNVPVLDDVRSPVTDLYLRRWRVAVEYEGRQHELDPGQFSRDLARYARLREHGIEYVQVTRTMMRSPRAVVALVHEALVRRGYDGPAPTFGGAWWSLFRPVRRRGGESATD